MNQNREITIVILGLRVTAPQARACSRLEVTHDGAEQPLGLLGQFIAALLVTYIGTFQITIFQMGSFPISETNSTKSKYTHLDRAGF